MHAAQTDKDINTRVWNTQHAADRLCVVVQDKNCYGSADGCYCAAVVTGVTEEVLPLPWSN